ncbi:4Fe-4S dicluster domain-containing protein [Caloramator sp. E03]|uniref:[Fe-Fe] hydrogenase large subunit C-terminal domain-containing protein n=1 Tax=Caloramator sp. E03 TaxID=2576307 RepID=UPI0011109A6E|nr:[Fe-Fe] hydrogenase large subunit C-terminal domain-containing protein [Caloramator sp. E03]QCX34145.1 4Fe-4S dicluster domain-containing protein [Caloramator sp. E03]
MNTIRFKEANCKNCYKCIRSCPVKAISFNNDQAQIMEDSCILCGNCLKVCPQNAKSVVDEIEKVKRFIEKKYKVYASIAPSFTAAFNTKSAKAIYNAIKKLGFAYIEETAIGAAKVSQEYEKLISNGKMKNIISTACPVIVLLAEKYYPEVLEYLAPVVSPMIAHAKIMKKLYGDDIKVVFIGPCLAKKEEYKDGENEKFIDAVITFEELQRWMDTEGISLIDEDEEEGSEKLNARFYPLVGGILKTIENKEKSNYRFISIDGIENCMKTFEAIKNGRAFGYFIEMNSCYGGCINGPCINNDDYSYINAMDKVLNYIEKANKVENISKFDIEIDLHKEFFNKMKCNDIPDEKTIRSILRKIGKFKKEDELNCGACGYSSCREKAIAVYNNKANLHMCLPYMREKAESLSNIIINSSPNAILALNRELYIHEANNAAYRIFNIENINLVGKNVYDFFDCPDFAIVKDTEKNILNQKYHYEKFDVTVEQSIIYVKDQDAIIIIMKDITKEEKSNKQLNKVRSETVEIAQKVIEKQMRVAQEIASLLGETTAETKVALTKLKDIIVTEMGEEI